MLFFTFLSLFLFFHVETQAHPTHSLLFEHFKEEHFIVDVQKMDNFKKILFRKNIPENLAKEIVLYFSYFLYPDQKTMLLFKKTCILTGDQNLRELKLLLKSFAYFNLSFQQEIEQTFKNITKSWYKNTHKNPEGFRDFPVEKIDNFGRDVKYYARKLKKNQNSNTRCKTDFYNHFSLENPKSVFNHLLNLIVDTTTTLIIRKNVRTINQKHFTGQLAPFLDFLASEELGLIVQDNLCSQEFANHFLKPKIKRFLEEKTSPANFFVLKNYFTSNT